jgi:electron transfer flavoprotein alpha subunit
MADIYAYITHKGGVADDSALELVAAAKKIDAGAPSPPSLPVRAPTLTKCRMRWPPLMPSAQVQQLDALAYPNAEVIRKLLVNVLPADAIVLIPHDTFGMDLAPGLSIKLDSPSWPTSWISKAWTVAP